MVNLSIHRNEDKFRDTKAKLEERRLSVVVVRCLAPEGDREGGSWLGVGMRGGVMVVGGDGGSQGWGWG
jgi:hypothetical protein